MADFDTALAQWQEGQRRLREAPAADQYLLERVAAEIAAGLRRRLGGLFTLEELADLYDEGTGWCHRSRGEVAPDEPCAWDARVIAVAAFGRYQRAATDYAGGRRIS